MMSFREIALRMNPLDPRGQPRGFGTATTLLELSEQHRWAPDAAATSFRTIVERHADSSTSCRLLWLNTYLLAGPEGVGSKPQVKGRSRELGRMLRNHFDVMFLCELLQQGLYARPYKDAMGAILSTRVLDPNIPASSGEDPPAAGDDPLGALISSGVSRIIHAWRGTERYPIVVRSTITNEGDDYSGPGLVSLLCGPFRPVRVDIHLYAAEGEGYDGIIPDLESDAWISKGVRLVELGHHVGAAILPLGVDVYYTHLEAAGGRSVRKKQLVELVEFIGRTRNPRNVVIVMGDFNVARGVDNCVDSTESEYCDLKRILLDGFEAVEGGTVSLQDVWQSAYGTGYTSIRDLEFEGVELVVDQMVPTVERVERKFSGCAVMNEFFHPHPTLSGVCAEPDEPSTFPRVDNPYPDNLSPTEPRTKMYEGRRIDYIFIESPTDAHRCNVDITRPLRARLERTEGDERDAVPLISDHLGLQVELIVTPRTGH